MKRFEVKVLVIVALFGLVSSSGVWADYSYPACKYSTQGLYECTNTWGLTTYVREVISKVAKLDGSEELKIELEHGAYTQSPHTITIVREVAAPPGAEKIVDRCLEVANHCKEDHHWFGLVVYYNPDDMPGGRPPEGETGPTGSRSWTFNLSEPVFSVACYCER